MLIATAPLSLGADFRYVEASGIRDILASIDELPIGQEERSGMLERNVWAWVRV